MRFKYPGGDVAYSTVLWMLLGLAGIWFGITTGKRPTYMLACLFTSAFALGMWFNLRFAGVMFAAVNVILSVLGIISLCLGAVTASVVSMVAWNIYLTWVTYEWIRDFKD